MSLLSGIAETVSTGINQALSRTRNLETVLGLPSAISENEKFFNQLIFQNGILDQIVMWTDSTMTTRLQTKVFTYVGGVLTKITTTRDSDQKVMETIIGYENGSVSSISKDFS